MGAAGGGRARAPRHVPICGRRKRGPVGEGWEVCCAGLLRKLLHMRLTGGCDSAMRTNAGRRLCHRIVASHHSVPQRTADEGVGVPPPTQRCFAFCFIGSDADGPVSCQLTGGFLLVVASTPSTGCDALCVQVLGGHPPSDRVRAAASLCP